MPLSPFQCLLYCSRSAFQKSDILLCASGSHIYSFDVSNGCFLAQWPPWGGFSNLNPENIKGHKSYAGAANPALREFNEVHHLAPSKRQKQSLNQNSSDSTSTETLQDTGSQHRHELDRVLSLDASTAVIKLAGTSNSQYIVAVTDGDKCIRVLELQDDGSLIQLSARPMPKRPCAIALTSDESTILCADKFGDVYSLPLLGFPYEPTSNVSVDRPARADDAEEAPEPFVPAANSKTVHTKKNQEALRNQLRTTNKKPEKTSLQFDHRLLLGHVSLLTDVASVTITDETSPSSPRPRSYILTADRDEHIRVSRGIPQTYVIEGYCLGHTEFVSKLCVPDWDKRTLISGGGDDYLLIWDWLTGTVRQKVDLKGPLDAFKADFVANLHQPGSMVPVSDTCYTNGEPLMEKLETKGPVDTFRNEYLATEASSPGIECLNIDGSERKIAVSGIWALKTTTPSHTGHIFVALEAFPTLLIFTLSPSSTLTFDSFHTFDGNLLDLATVPSRAAIIYSLDHHHRPFSTTKQGEERGMTPSRTMIGALKLATDGRWEQDPVLEKTMAGIADHARRIPSRMTLSYGVESLRKRAGDQDD